MLRHGAGEGRTQRRSLVGKRQGREPRRRKSCLLPDKQPGKQAVYRMSRAPARQVFKQTRAAPPDAPNQANDRRSQMGGHGLQRSGCSAVWWPQGSVWLSHVAWRQDRADGLAKRSPGRGAHQRWDLLSAVQDTLQRARPQHWGESRGSQGSSTLRASTACQQNQQTSV